MKKISLALIFGGQSVEHEVSLRSAKNVLAALDKKKYSVTLIKINKTGGWQLLKSDTLESLSSGQDRKLIKDKVRLDLADHQMKLTSEIKETGNFDAVFPILHGPYGEDGTVQGMLALAHLPYVGAGVLGSAVGMDKDVAKRLLREAKIPINKFLSFQAYEKNQYSYTKVSKLLGKILFIKPANAGSSVGVSKVYNQTEYNQGLKKALTYDNKIIIEEFISGREIECSVLGNDKPQASVPGEIIPNHDFYSYEAKYLDENGAILKIPAKLSKKLIKEVQQLAIKTFQALSCSGMARVDFFLTKDNRLLVNEINTIPGFTNISMYPRLWEESGISYSQLIDRLIELALERHQENQKLKTSY